LWRPHPRESRMQKEDSSTAAAEIKQETCQGSKKPPSR